MKNFKRIAAIAMAATMLVGSGLTVFAEEIPPADTGVEGGGSGSGEFEGFVDTTSVFSASVPTSAGTAFNFFVDPNKLLEKTQYERLKDSGKGADDFEAGSTLFFTRTDADKEFGKDSDKITATNMSSYDVDIEVNATITGIDGITMSATEQIDSGTQDPTLYLAIVHDTTKNAISAKGGQLTGTIAGKADNFDIQYNKEKSQYEYAQKADASGWATYDFNLTGACGGVWTDAQAEVTPTVELIWKITDPKDVPRIKVDAAAGSFTIIGLDGSQYKSMSLNEGIKDSYISAPNDGTWVGGWNPDPGADKEFKLAANWISYLKGRNVVFTVYLSDGSSIQSASAKFPE